MSNNGAISSAYLAYDTIVLANSRTIVGVAVE